MTFMPARVYRVNNSVVIGEFLRVLSGNALCRGAKLPNRLKECSVTAIGRKEPHALILRLRQRDGALGDAAVLGRQAKAEQTA